MTIIASIIYQSPCTPVEEVTYVVTIVNRNPEGLDEISSKEKYFLSELEKYCTNILTPIHIGSPNIQNDTKT